MIGDGVNDIWALRTADIGISLNLNETSISAHFITKNSDISYILNIICEGKGCLSNTVEFYKYIIFCSIIKFSSSVILLSFNSVFHTYQLILTDLFLIFPIAFLIARTSPIKILSEEALKVNLNFIVWSLLFQSFIMVIFQFISIYLLKQRN